MPIPRRHRIDLFIPAERAIREAQLAVEDAGTHPLLTEATILLGQARDKVADYAEQVEGLPHNAPESHRGEK